MAIYSERWNSGTNTAFRMTFKNSICSLREDWDHCSPPMVWETSLGCATWVPQLDLNHNARGGWTGWCSSLPRYKKQEMVFTDNVFSLCSHGSSQLVQVWLPLLLAEIEQRPKELSTASLISQCLHFSDTLPHLRQVWKWSHLSNHCTFATLIHVEVKKDGHQEMKDVWKFGL